MKNLFFSYCTLISLLFCSTTYSQTSGISDVTSIESKASAYDNNKIKISQFKSELFDLEILWRAKIKKLKDELAALYTERDNLISDMKVGAKCSQCSKYKSEFEKEGKNFQQHLGEVQGYAVPATTEELEATRKAFIDRIAYKKVQIQNMEKGDNAVIKKQNDINTLEKANENLCEEITAHSKNYETKVFSEAKAKHDNWVNDLMSYATNILIADDKITIYNARIVRYEKEFQDESAKIRDRVKKENLDVQNSKNKQILIDGQRIKETQTEQADYIASVEIKLVELKRKKVETETDLNNLTISDSVKDILTKSLNQLIVQINSLDKNLLDYNTSIKSKISALENDNKKLKDEIFQLSTNLTKHQAQEIDKIKPLYDQKKLEATQNVVTSITELTNARKAYAEKAEYYKKQNQLFFDIVVTESNRMVIASQKINCSVYNEVRGMVMTNWNKVFPCVNALTTMAKPYGTNVFNVYCPGKSTSSYMANYKSFLLGLSTEDKEAVKGNSNANWFDLITQ